MIETADRHHAVRAALTDAAERAIEESGLAGLKARDLAREAGCALGAIYTVFPDLDALVFAVNMRTLQAMEAAVARSVRTRARATDDPAAQLVALALGYLAYAARHRQRWAALFAHSVAPERPVPQAYRDLQSRLFVQVAAPLGRLCPSVQGAELVLLSRTLFSAVHGIVSVGLDEKLAPTPPTSLRRQVRLVVAAMAHGLAPSACEARK